MRFISFDEGDSRLDWLPLTEALAAGHKLPLAGIEDSFIRRGGDTLLSRAAWIDGMGVAVKSAMVLPREGRTSSIGGLVTLFGDQTGEPEALLDFRLVTKWKTAGDSLLGALRLARPESRKILIVGAGTVAETLRAAYGAGFPDASFAIWNRTPARAEAMAEGDDRMAVAYDLAEAVAESDIVTSATMTTDPVLKGDWFRPGQHIDLIGAYRADMREVDDTALTRAKIFVDSRQTTLDHIGELKIPLAEGVITPADIQADFYELGSFTRRPEDITLFKNGGGAHLDLMTARHILKVCG